ncbi:NB-ARC domain-containing protein [Streptomyces prunicolor]|uniref:NB-ARC domain-containing protein n=1 Tax=Streptomyces prunicolor TaxID=67348 RepID=UPI00343057EA
MPSEYGDHLDFRDARITGFTAKEERYYPRPPREASASLPGAPAVFLGRDHELDQVMRVLDPNAVDTGTEARDPYLAVCVVSGREGLGKSALALRAAHQAVANNWFPGGVFYLDLHRPGTEPLSDDQAVRILLSYLGVVDDEISGLTTAWDGHYHTCLAQRPGPALLLLDNAVQAEQIERLRPGVAHHRVLVTSRSGLADLEAHAILLRPLSTSDSLSLLVTLLSMGVDGENRTVQEPDAASSLVDLCEGVPLNIRRAAAGLRQRRDVTIAEYVKLLVENRAAYEARLRAEVPATRTGWLQRLGGPRLWRRGQ